jgi:hypothetical protein
MEMEYEEINWDDYPDIHPDFRREFFILFKNGFSCVPLLYELEAQENIKKLINKEVNLSLIDNAISSFELSKQIIFENLLKNKNKM